MGTGCGRSSRSIIGVCFSGFETGSNQGIGFDQVPQREEQSSTLGSNYSVMSRNDGESKVDIAYLYDSWKLVDSLALPFVFQLLQTDGYGHGF